MRHHIVCATAPGRSSVGSHTMYVHSRLQPRVHSLLSRALRATAGRRHLPVFLRGFADDLDLEERICHD